jgi:hypothetical protein
MSFRVGRLEIISIKPEILHTIGDHHVSGAPRAEDLLHARTALARHRGELLLPRKRVAMVPMSDRERDVRRAESRK